MWLLCMTGIVMLERNRDSCIEPGHPGSFFIDTKGKIYSHFSSLDKEIFCAIMRQKNSYQISYGRS